MFVIESNHGVPALSTDDLRGALEAGQAVWRDLIENESRVGEYVRFDPIEIRRFFQSSPDRHANFQYSVTFVRRVLD